MREWESLSHIRRATAGIMWCSCRSCGRTWQQQEHISSCRAFGMDAFIVADQLFPAPAARSGARRGWRRRSAQSARPARNSRRRSRMYPLSRGGSRARSRKDQSSKADVGSRTKRGQYRSTPPCLRSTGLCRTLGVTPSNEPPPRVLPSCARMVMCPKSRRFFCRETAGVDRSRADPLFSIGDVTAAAPDLVDLFQQVPASRRQ